ncbi:MAG: hypothetical protein JWR39_692 [Devosia sp.]|jgi:hypothetical protein|nr:hypothetical protein [Devosia sp.]
MLNASRRLTSTVAGILLCAAAAVPALAHHGWSWTASGFFQIEGVITATYIGNPHATLDVDVEGTTWRVELAPPGPTTQAGFTEDVAPLGTEVIAIGNRSVDSEETRMKAVRIIIDGQQYDVYPSRAQEI